MWSISLAFLVAICSPMAMFRGGLQRVLAAFTDGFPGAFGSLSSLLAAILAAFVFQSLILKCGVVALAVVLFIGQWFEASGRGRKARTNQTKMDDIHADFLERKAATQIQGAIREANELSAELLRFVIRRENERPTPQWALSLTNDQKNWQGVFFGSAGQHIISSMNEYQGHFRERVDEVVKKLGGESEIERLNTPPFPGWPNDVRMISERLAALAERKSHDGK